MNPLPASAELDGIKWHLRTCEACAGAGNRVRITSDTLGRESRVALTCKPCGGRGYHRQLTPFV